MSTTLEAPPATGADSAIVEALKDATAHKLADQHAAGDTEPEKKGRLFDATQFDSPELQLPKIDGEGVDKLHAQFGGLVRLERSLAADVKLIRDTKMGTTIHLLVEVEVGPPNARFTTNKDGDLDALSLGRNFKVVSVSRPAAEEL